MPTHDAAPVAINAVATETYSLPLQHSLIFRSCNACLRRFIEQVTTLPGVENAQMEKSSSCLFVAYDSRQLSLAQVREHTARAEAQIVRRFAHQTYHIGNMDCAHCAEGVEKMAATQKGVISAVVHFSAARLQVEYEAERPEAVVQIERRAQAMGFPLTPLRNEREKTRGSENQTSKPSSAASYDGQPVAVYAAALLLAVGFLEHGLHAPPFATRATFLAAMSAGGYRFVRAGMASLREKVVGTNLLMTVAALGAVVLGQWEEAASVVVLYAVGVALEARAMNKTRRSLQTLLGAFPDEAVVQRHDLRTETITADQVAVGDTLIVRPGAKIAAEGVVVSGASAVVEAAITGESLPKSKHKGDVVHAGSVNGDGTLLVCVTAAYRDSTLARILHLVEEAQARKAPVQALVERFGHIYTPIVLVSAFCLALLGPVFAPGINWTYRALTLLVVACPCALLIATPVAYVSAITRAAQNGVLLKGGACLESLASVQHVFLDKTGTLTQGHFHITDVLPTDTQGSDDELIRIVVAMEQYSEHPLAHALVLYAARKGEACASPPNVSGLIAVPGRGITALMDGRETLVGNAALLQDYLIPLPEDLESADARLRDEGKTTVWIAQGGQAAGLLAAADTLRPHAREAVASLLQIGKRVTLLTGDNSGAAQSAAGAAGIDDWQGGLLPQEKLAFVEQETRRGEAVLFVGDGINDAPALAAATVGAAMGAGTAAALETADVALTTNDLSRIPWLLSLAQSTRDIVRANLIIAVVSSVALLVATLMGRLTLPLGVAGHEGAALLIILNGTRLLAMHKRPL